MGWAGTSHHGKCRLHMIRVVPICESFLFFFPGHIIILFLDKRSLCSRACTQHAASPAPFLALAPGKLPPFASTHLHGRPKGDDVPITGQRRRLWRSPGGHSYCVGRTREKE